MATEMTAILGKKKKSQVDSVTIRKAANGFTLECYDGNRSNSMIAESLEEAIICAKEMFSIKDSAENEDKD